MNARRNLLMVCIAAAAFTACGDEGTSNFASVIYETRDEALSQCRENEVATVYEPMSYCRDLGSAELEPVGYACVPSSSRPGESTSPAVTCGATEDGSLFADYRNTSMLFEQSQFSAECDCSVYFERTEPSNFDPVIYETEFDARTQCAEREVARVYDATESCSGNPTAGRSEVGYACLPRANEPSLDESSETFTCGATEACDRFVISYDGTVRFDQSQFATGCECCGAEGASQEDE